MSDHTPSPATDGLREAIEALLEAVERDARHPWSRGPEGQPSVAAIDVSTLRRVLAAHPALLADPAPEAAREGERWRHTLEYAATALEGSADNGDRYCAHQIRQHLGQPDGCGSHNPADLPVATGVTTEDEGCKECGQTAAMHTRGGRSGLNRWCTPAPAPVVSAGDEGMELSRDEKDQIRVACRKGLGEPLYAAVERILAARVAEAEARALEEAEQRLVAIQNACNKTGDYNGGLSGAIAVIRELRADQ